MCSVYQACGIATQGCLCEEPYTEKNNPEIPRKAIYTSAFFKAQLGEPLLEILINLLHFFIFSSAKPSPVLHLSGQNPALKRAKPGTEAPKPALKKGKKAQEDENRHLSAETGT